MPDKRKLSKDGSIHVTDEVINTVTHIIGTIFAVTVLVFLVVNASITGKIWHIISFSIYGVSLLSVFIASSFHHGLNASKNIEKILCQFDYFAIFLLIAGTYTPLCLITLRGPLGWSVFGIVWFLAAAGITIKAIFPGVPKWLTNTIYISMGWLSAIIVFPLFNMLGLKGFIFLLTGGIFYTAGSIIFYSERPNPIPGKFGFHEIWHIFVLLGALSHAILMYFYLLPSG